MTEYIYSTPYLDDILHQPDALADTLASFSRGHFDAIRKYADQLHSGKFRRLVLTGMGSSYHALHPLMLGLLKEGLQAQMIETSELIHHAPALLREDSLVVAVSQSGASAEILQLLDRIPPKCALIGITNTENSPLADWADSALVTCAGDESTVSCKTYITALAALALLEFLLIGKDPSARIAELQSLPKAIGDYLAGLNSFLEYLEQALNGITYLILAGRGASLAAVGTGGLIIKEAAHFPAEGMSSAAFRHGPLEMASAETFVVVYEGISPTQRLNRNLVEDIRRMEGSGALVEISPEQHVFHLPPNESNGLPILEILPAQMLSLALAHLGNHVPGVFTHGSKVTSVE